MAMRRSLIGAAIGVGVFAAALALAWVVLNGYYGSQQVSYSTQVIIIEDYGQVITTGGARFGVENAVAARASSDGDYYSLLVVPESNLMGGVPEDMAPAPTGAAGAGTGEYSGQLYVITVPSAAYDLAVETGEPQTVSTVIQTERTPVDSLPIAMSIGAAAGLVAVAIWFGYRQSWGEATSTLLEHGLCDMTVRDVEIVGYIMERGEFTIPELMKLTDASKITVWRTVQKLEEKGLVQQTESTKQAANGLGGRGKPSRVYKYVGEKSEIKQKAGAKIPSAS